MIFVIIFVVFFQLPVYHIIFQYYHAKCFTTHGCCHPSLHIYVIDTFIFFSLNRNKFTQHTLGCVTMRQHIKYQLCINESIISSRRIGKKKYGCLQEEPHLYLITAIAMPNIGAVTFYYWFGLSILDLISEKWHICPPPFPIKMFFDS